MTNGRRSSRRGRGDTRTTVVRGGRVAVGRRRRRRRRAAADAAALLPLLRRLLTSPSISNTFFGDSRLGVRRRLSYGGLPLRARVIGVQQLNQRLSHVVPSRCVAHVSLASSRSAFSRRRRAAISAGNSGTLRRLRRVVPQHVFPTLHPKNCYYVSTWWEWVEMVVVHILADLPAT